MPDGTKLKRVNTVIAGIALAASFVSASIALQSMSTAKDALLISRTDGVRMRLADEGRKAHNKNPQTPEAQFSRALMLYLIETYLADAEEFGFVEYAENQAIITGTLRTLAEWYCPHAKGDPVAKYIAGNPRSVALANDLGMTVDCTPK